MSPEIIDLLLGHPLTDISVEQFVKRLGRVLRARESDDRRIKGTTRSVLKEAQMMGARRIMRTGWAPEYVG